MLNIGDLIFKDLKSVGFWISGWRAKHSPEEFRQMVLKLAGWLQEGKLKGPKCKEFKLSKFKHALEMSQAGFHNTKVLFTSLKLNEFVLVSYLLF